VKIGDVEVFSVTEAAERIGIAPGTLRVQIHNGAVKAEKIGGRYLVTAEEVERYRSENKGKHGVANPNHPYYGRRGGGGRRKRTPS
jgi:excisionase family DNA binding protein